MHLNRPYGHEENHPASRITMTEAASIYRFATQIDWLSQGFRYPVGSVGDSYDNAPAETTNGLYKAEVIRKNGPRKGLDDVERAILTWVEWFNHRRLLSSIGDRPSNEYENLHYQQTESADVA